MKMTPKQALEKLREREVHLAVCRFASEIQWQTKCTRSEALRVAEKVVTRENTGYF